MPHTGLFNHGQEIQTEALPKRLDITAPRRDPTATHGRVNLGRWGKLVAKARAANGETASAEARAKMSASHTGLKHSAETRAKITAANYRRWNTQPATPAPAARETHSIEPDVLDATMTAGDLLFALENLHFSRNRDALSTLRIDRQKSPRSAGSEDSGRTPPIAPYGLTV
jgi:NUMOD3 motif